MLRRSGYVAAEVCVLVVRLPVFVERKRVAEEAVLWLGKLAFVQVPPQGRAVGRTSRTAIELVSGVLVALAFVTACGSSDDSVVRVIEHRMRSMSRSAKASICSERHASTPRMTMSSRGSRSSCFQRMAPLARAAKKCPGGESHPWAMWLSTRVGRSSRSRGSRVTRVKLSHRCSCGADPGADLGARDTRLAGASECRRAHVAQAALRGRGVSPSPR